jgi:hypothetical protein
MGWYFRDVVSGRFAWCRFMHSRWVAHLVWSILIAEGVAVLSGIAIELFSKPWRRSIGDTLFVEGAIFLVMGGLLDLSRSITVSQIRGLARVGQGPPTIRTPGRISILVIAGLLMCAQGILLGRLFSDPRG